MGNARGQSPEAPILTPSHLHASSRAPRAADGEEQRQGGVLSWAFPANRGSGLAPVNADPTSCWGKAPAQDCGSAPASAQTRPRSRKGRPSLLILLWDGGGQDRGPELPRWSPGTPQSTGARPTAPPGPPAAAPPGQDVGAASGQSWPPAVKLQPRRDWCHHASVLVKGEQGQKMAGGMKKELDCVLQRKRAFLT